MKEHLHETTVSQFNIAENVADLYKEKQVGTFIVVFVFVFVLVQGERSRWEYLYLYFYLYKKKQVPGVDGKEIINEQDWSAFKKMVDQHFKKNDWSAFQMPMRWDDIVENVVDTYKEKKVGMKSVKVSIYADERNVIRWQQVADTHKENQLIERKYQNQRLFWWHGIENIWSDLYEEKQVWTSPRIW